jgi:hypothetical protein
MLLLDKVSNRHGQVLNIVTARTAREVFKDVVHVIHFTDIATDRLNTLHLEVRCSGLVVISDTGIRS